MPSVLFVALGGALGAVLRFKASGFFLHRSPDALFPYGTFFCNVLGCFAIGVIAVLAERYHWFSNDMRLLLITGLLGGFTTFSAFGFETIYLLRRGELGVAVVYVFASVLLGLCVLWFGYRLAGS